MKKSTPLILSFLSICIALNYVGANIALFLKQFYVQPLLQDIDYMIKV